MRLRPGAKGLLAAAGLLATLALLLVHARVYAFLCDDAFISFRYARNLSEGHGLVFNPGFERVEGYTNFLWVLILAGLHRIGLAPESVASVLSLAATAGLWGVVAWFARRTARGEGEGAAWTTLLPVLFLAATRSVAVWATSGLETRLFELLAVGGVLRLAAEVESRLAGGMPRPAAALLLAAAALTRPDGLLIGAVTLGTAETWLASKARRIDFRRSAISAAAFGIPVAAHFLFRYAYYGSWLPNTYYAKVGGRTWWSMGLAYEGAFALEYAVWLWIPLLAAALAFHRARGSLHVPLLFAAALVPHALYVASIGGDHFEYRPLDLVFPFAFLLLGDGALRLARSARGAIGAALLAALVVVGLVALPLRSHLEFPREYGTGFPGLAGDREGSAEFLDPARDPIYRLPVLRSLAAAHRDLVRLTTSRLVAVRQEEHALFLRQQTAAGKKLRALVDQGVIPRDAHLALACVGAVPYYSDLRTLDVLGLTDAHVARSEPAELRILAHERHATLEYAAQSGVDYWPRDPARPVLALDDYAVLWYLDQAPGEGIELYWSPVGEKDVLLGQLPLGPESARMRFPSLAFRAASEPGSLADLHARIEALAREALRRDPGSFRAKLDLAAILAREERYDDALAIYRGLEAVDDADVHYNLGTICGRLGRYAEAVAPLERAVRLRPRFAMARYNLGVALAKGGRTAEGIGHLRAAVDLWPDYAAARYALAAACLSAGERACALAERDALRALGTESAGRLADRVEAALGGP